MNGWRNRASLALLVGGVCLLAPAVAQAASINFTVTNGAGRPQDNVAVKVNGQGGYATGSDGTVALGGLQPGDRVSFTRQWLSCEPTPPEGRDGVTYAVPASPPENVSITVPTVIDNVGAAPNGAAQALAGEINQLREQRGLAPLEISTTLSAAARWEARTAMESDCLGSLGTIDSGWPASNWVWIAADVADYSEKAAARFIASKSYSGVFEEDVASLGVGFWNGTWTTQIGRQCPDGFAAACGMLAGNYGIPPAGPTHAPKLRLLSAKGKGHRVRLVYHLAAGARGRLSVAWRGRGRAGAMRVRRHGSRATARDHLGPGDYRVKATFAGTDPWPSATSCTKLKLGRHPPRRERHSWSRLFNHSCG